MNDRLGAALFTPGWPSGFMPNGIVTYTACMLPWLRLEGVDPFVLGAKVGPGCTDGFAVDVEAAQRPISFFDRIKRKLQDRAEPGAWGERRFGDTIAEVAGRIARERGVRIVEMEESFGWVAQVNERAGIPAIARLHGPWFLNGPMVESPDSSAFKRRVRLEGEAIAAAPGVTAPSRDVLEQTKRKYGLALPEAEVIPCPIEPAAAEARWSADACDPEMVLFVGRFDNHKAGDVVLDAFRIVRGERPSAKLVFVGPDRGVRDKAGRTWSIGEFMQDRFPQGAAAAGVEYMGQQKPEAIGPLRRRAGVTVIASRYENFAYTVLEAMSVGSPTIITGVGGLPELIEHERSGLVVPPGDATALAAAMLRMLGDRAMATRLAAQAYADCDRKFHPRVVSRDTAAFYRKVLARTGGARP